MFSSYFILALFILLPAVFDFVCYLFLLRFFQFDVAKLQPYKKNDVSVSEKNVSISEFDVSISEKNVSQFGKH
jgi:hypothetical protein